MRSDPFAGNCEASLTDSFVSDEAAAAERDARS
jgi:hypothetical protein